MLLSSCGDNAIIKLNLDEVPFFSDKKVVINKGAAGGQLVEAPNGYKIQTGIQGISSTPNSCNSQGICAQISISK